MAKITVSEIEFDKIKESLKDFLKSQSEFSDYNFEGSGLSVLLDVLAFNTHYNALYDNMLVNESFLDSATNRGSVVSRAAELSYVPKSATCAKIVIDIEATPSSSIPVESLPYTISIPEYTTFTSNSLGFSVQFFNTQEIVLTKDATNKYVATEITLLSGTPNRYMFQVTGVMDSFVLPNPNIDTSTLKVIVFEDATASSFYNVWNPVTRYTSLDSDTKAYWLKEVDGGLYEMKFGDGILGKALGVGNIITVNYMISSGSNANGVKSLSFGGNQTIDGISTAVSISKIYGPAFNGSEPETIESIKFNAPRAYSTQNRAVTAEDFKNIVLSEFADARSVSVWGGEDNVPPVYGKVFIAVAQHSAKPLSLLQKETIKSILRTKKALTIIPEIVDGEYLNVVLSVTSYYNSKETTLSTDDIRARISEAISLYNDDNLQAFDKILRESRLTRMIDSVEKSIVSTRVNINLRVDIVPMFDVESKYTATIINPIIPGTIISNGIYVFSKTQNVEYNNVMFIEDDSLGNLRMYYYDINSNKIILESNIGTVDYDKGSIIINNLEIVAINNGDYLSLTMTPKNKDIVSALTKIVKIDSVSINVIDDKTASGDLRAGFNFQF